MINGLTFTKEINWYWCTSDGLDDIWTPCTNNGNEGSNGRLRSQMFRNHIQSFNTEIGPMVSKDKNAGTNWTFNAGSIGS
jgi:hypothetical protein